MTEKPSGSEKKESNNAMAMMRAMSSGVAGLKAHQTALDVIGNNIANVNTYGFKASRTLFSDILYQTLTSATAPDDTTGAGGLNPSQVGYGATASAVQVDTGRAGMATTGRSNDCYINGEGYFVVADGAPATTGGAAPSSYKYTRVGALSFDSAGYLVDSNGNRVCGIPVNTPNDLLNATLDTSVSVPRYIHYDTSQSLSDISIAADGTITALLDGSVVTIGQIEIAHFVNPAGLEQMGGNYYKATDNSGNATIESDGSITSAGLSFETPGSSATGNLVTGALESSNVDLANEFSNMITTERGYQANSKIITVADEMLETLVSMVR
ncbi:MAG: Flagellar basal body protein [Clostridium sp.]|jgi:flagellar hook protein FlgE